jgi:hypothetical protein
MLRESKHLVIILVRNGRQQHQTSAEAFDIFAGVLVPDIEEPPAGLVSSQTPSDLAEHIVHYGDYAYLGKAHNEVLDWCRRHGQEPTGLPTCFRVTFLQRRHPMAWCS